MRSPARAAAPGDQVVLSLMAPAAQSAKRTAPRMRGLAMPTCWNSSIPITGPAMRAAPPTEAVSPSTVPCSASPAVSEISAVVAANTSPEPTASTASPGSRTHRLSETATSSSPTAVPMRPAIITRPSPSRSASRPTSSPWDTAAITPMKAKSAAISTAP